MTINTPSSGGGSLIDATTRFPEFIRNMDKAGYLPVDTNALMAAYTTLHRMLRSEEGNPVSTLILDGPPGVGKTFMPQTFIKLMGGTYLEYNCHPDSTKEELERDLNILIPTLSQSGLLDKKPGIEDMYLAGQLYDAVRLSHEGPVVLVIDELDKARSAVDALLLGFLNSGYISVQGAGKNYGIDRKYADVSNLIVVITKNDERDLHPAMLRRGRVVYMDYPPANVEQRLLTQSTGVGEEAAKAIVTMANKLRRHKNVMKPPSPPELARLAQDFMLLANVNVRKRISADGSEHLECDIPNATLNQSFLNGILAMRDDHDLGRKLLANKSAGKSLFKAVLRGMGYPESMTIKHNSVNVLTTPDS